jgi:hypothetical protein
MVARECNYSTWDVEEGGSSVQDQSELPSKLRLKKLRADDVAQ